MLRFYDASKITSTGRFIMSQISFIFLFVQTFRGEGGDFTDILYSMTALVQQTVQSIRYSNSFVSPIQFQVLILSLPSWLYYTIIVFASFSKYFSFYDQPSLYFFS